MNEKDIEKAEKVLSGDFFDFMTSYAQSRGIDFKMLLVKAQYEKTIDPKKAEITEADAIGSVCKEVQYLRIIDAIQTALTCLSEFKKLQANFDNLTKRKVLDMTTISLLRAEIEELKNSKPILGRADTKYIDDLEKRAVDQAKELARLSALVKRYEEALETIIDYIKDDLDESYNEEILDIAKSALSKNEEEV